MSSQDIFEDALIYIAYRLAKLPMATVLRARTFSKTRGFMKALIDTKSDRILGFTMFGVAPARSWRPFKWR